MPAFTITLPGGRSWTPRFATAIDREKCIGCGRCFKVCGRGVLQLMALDDEGRCIAIEDGDDDEYEKKVMTIAHAENCVGCEACARTCAKKCISHAPAEA
ncbi:MAG TPA: ferredoxin III, nif-specific [Burkholderiales bacterium]|nr:ferredoxin III, nif-specific [Burkholderiales bacterium]